MDFACDFSLEGEKHEFQPGFAPDLHDAQRKECCTIFKQVRPCFTNGQAGTCKISFKSMRNKVLHRFCIKYTSVMDDECSFQQNSVAGVCDQKIHSKCKKCMVKSIAM